jgi:hypothetical protein
MSEGEAGMVKGILGLGEDRFHEAVAQLLANDRFVNAMQGAITGGLSAKRSVDKNIDRIYSFANVPTLEDVEQVRDKMLELEDLLGDVRDRIVRLDAKLQERQSASAKKPAAKKAVSKKSTSKKATTKRSTAKKG